MPLVDVSEEMGSMSFADGSHKDGLISRKQGISDQSEAFFEGFIAGAKYSVHTSGAMRAGDATFHSGLTLHRAPGNPTDRYRDVMTVIYFADGLTVEQPQNGFQEGDLASWFPGLQPGDLAASEINLVLTP
jgi:ectoine hydroxylase-related dioxygenase (phytanoyl-CoA dioxygenase family)